MFSTTSVFALLSVAASFASAGLVPRRDPPAGWNFAILEDYQTYHTRYLALGCEFQHGKAFFDTCCHPHLNWQQLSSFPAECTPSAAAMSSASAAEPTSTVTTPADADESDVETVTVTSTSGEAGPTGTSDDDDDDDEDCDPEDDGDDDETTTSAPAPTTTESHKSSSTKAPAPATTTQAKATTTQAKATTKSTPKPTTTSQAAKASSSPSSSNSGSGDFITGGFATFFTQNGVAGACGNVHSDFDLIAAIDQDRYGDSGAVSSLCGKQVQIINTNNGKSVTVTIQDDCPTCDNGNSIDLSVGAFTAIATEDEGIVPIKWQFL
ncbi:barwin-like endoglucanase [Schizopora paradoxa]|uniref:Barwin-like endoglucanase n=1 Tax=Schizopora paradoxa TaxID=27342 RepID=A0A0H2RSV1_9AGAM|nr:barwin-like endoglucanase [Schizopora paradoxa]